MQQPMEVIRAVRPKSQPKFGGRADASPIDVDVGSLARRSPDERFSDDEDESMKWHGYDIKKKMRAGARKVAHKFGSSPPK